MRLHIIIDEYTMQIEVDDALIAASRERFARLDHNMDQGLKLGHQWIENPDTEQRCQSAADKLLSAIETHNESLALLSAGYILSRYPDISCVRIDTSGESANTRFE
ncbi:MAG: hypothetical protein AB2807_05425 [Candidatus Sedimenticola endophacoides]